LILLQSPLHHLVSIHRSIHPRAISACCAALLTMACAPGQIEQTTVSVVAGSPTCTTQPSGSRTVCNQPVGGVQQCWVQQYGGQVTCQPVTEATTTCVTPDVAAAAVQ